MSIEAMTRVWKVSRAKGPELLVLLAIADWADDEGRNSWGTEAKLAGKSRMSERGVRKVLGRLVALGELEIEKNDDGKRVLNGHVPRRFMHVLCCREPEQRSGSHPERGSGSIRNGVPVQPEQRSGSGDRRTGTGRYNEPEREGRRIRKIRQDPSKSSRRARDGRRPHPLDEPMIPLPRMLELLDELKLVYPQKDGDEIELARVWRELNLTIEQAEFVVANVRMRVAAGSVADVGGVRYVPHLWRWLESRRWNKPAATTAGASSTPECGPDGRLVMATCRCGRVLEGRVQGGRPVYPACPNCNPNNQASERSA